MFSHPKIARTAKQRGFVHVLLLVLLVLGLSMWGLSALLQEAVDSKIESDKRQDINQFDAKNALLDYAVVSPQPIASITRPGWYNAYQQSGVRIPFRRFFLPCPDLSGDGVSDIFRTTLAVSCLNGEVVDGLLPWRQFSGTNGAGYEFIRGMGEGGDFNEGYRQAHRYTLAAPLNNTLYALNAHRLLRLTVGWLTVTASGGAVFSDRAAAVITSPDPLVASDSNERPQYVTIDELLGEAGPGVAVLESPGAENIYEFLDGNGEGLGIVELMNNHLRRFGYLPTPAMFDNRGATVRFRPSGPPVQVTTQLPGQVNDEPGVFNVQGIGQQPPVVRFAPQPITAVIRAKDLPPVYLLGAEGFFVDGTAAVLADNPFMSPPYNIALLAMETALNDLAGAFPSDNPARRAVEALRSTDHYPGDAFTYIETTTASPLTPALGGLPPLAIMNLNTPLNITLTGGDILPIMFAEESFGYYEGSKYGNEGNPFQYPSSSRTRFTGDGARDIDTIPPYSAKYRLVPGTRAFLPTDEIVIRLPANYQFIGSFDQRTRSYRINGFTGQPVIVDAPATLLLSVLVLSHIPAEVGDVGMFPIAEASVTVLASGVSLSMLDNAISELSQPMVVYSESKLTLIAFPPPGRPVRVSAPIGSLPLPLIIPANSEFTLPAGARVIYPPDSSVIIGDGFAFPDDAIVQYPPESYVTAILPAGSPGGGLPVGSAGGRLPGNYQDVLVGLDTTNYQVGARFTASFRLPFGAVLQLQNVKPVTEGPEVVGERQRLLDIELRGGAVAFSGSRAIATLSANRVLRPFTGVMLTAEPAWDIPDGADIHTGNQGVRWKFFTSPDSVIQPNGGVVDVKQQIVGTAWARVASPSGYSPIEGLDPNTGRPNGTGIATLTIELDEDVFLMTGANGLVFPFTRNVTVTTGNGRVLALNGNFEFLPNSWFFDPQNKEAIEVMLAEDRDFRGDINRNQLLAFGTRTDRNVTLVQKLPGGGYIENRLMLLPDNDILITPDPAQLSVDILVKGGSIIDMVRGRVYPPVGLQRVPAVASDLQVVSNKDMQIYFPHAATLVYFHAGDGFPRRQLVYDQNAPGQNPLPPPVLVSHNPAPAMLPYTGQSVDSNNIVSIREGILDASRELQIPANSYIVVPPGTPLDFLSDTLTQGPLAPNADYMNIPDGAALVVLPGEVLTAVNRAGVISSQTGPLYVGLRGDVAMVNHPSLLSVPPLVFLNDTAYLKDEAGLAVRENVFRPIPAAARLDMLGNMERRADDGLNAELMPLDNAEFLRDFPMVYAVAPECRKGPGVMFAGEGEECASADGDGLNVLLQEGDEYVLQEDFLLPHRAYIANNQFGTSVQVKFYPSGVGPGSGVGGEFSTGELRLIAGNRVIQEFANRSNHDTADHEKIVVYPERDGLQNKTTEAKLRVYLQGHGSPIGIPDRNRDEKNTYIEVDGPLTVYSGGFYDNPDVFDNAGVPQSVDGGGNTVGVGPIVIPAGAEIYLAPGSKLGGVQYGDAPFGPGSRAILPATGVGGRPEFVDLGPYRIFNPEEYILDVEFSADSAEVDLFGNLYERPFKTGQTYEIDAGVGRVGAPALFGDDTGDLLITVAPGAVLPTESGYLWQGYIPFAQRTISFARGGNTGNYQRGFGGGDWPPARVDIRIQPTVRILNTWGSGLERPDTLNGQRSGRFTHLNMEVNVVGRPDDKGPANIGYSGGFLAGLRGNADFLPITVIVYNLETGKQHRTTARWRSHVPYGIGFFNRMDDPALSGSLTVGFRWNKKNNPLPGFDRASFAGERFQPDVGATVAGVSVIAIIQWVGNIIYAGRLVGGYQGPSSRGTCCGGPDYNNDGEEAYIDNYNQPAFGCDGDISARVPFNPPDFMMISPSGNFTLASASPKVTHRFPFLNSRANVVTAVFAGAPWRPNSRGIGRGPRVVEIGDYQVDTRQIPYPVSDGLLPDIPEQTYPAAANLGARGTGGIATDMAFYIDRAYNPIRGSYLPPLRFGADFVLSGPGALVPPFGGTSKQAVRDVFAQRSKLMNDVVGYPPLSPIYDDKTGACTTVNSCPAFFLNPDWYPIVGGILAFGGDGYFPNLVVPSATTALSEEIRLIMPQPEAAVEDINGNMITVHAGSIIYPQRGLIYPSTPLPEGNYELYLPAEGAVGAVDVSPVTPPNPIKLFRDPQGRMTEDDFNFTPLVHRHRIPGTNEPRCIIQPINFADANSVIDFGHRNDYGDITEQASYSGAGVSLHADEVLRYDTTFGRGVLMDENGTNLMLSYYRGDNRYTANPQYYKRSRRTQSQALYNTTVPFLEPSSYLWHQNNLSVTLQAGTQKDFTFSHPVGPNFTGANSEEFLLARLAHRISIPGGNILRFSGYSKDFKYPTKREDFFQFPDNTRLLIANNDANSYVSANPYIARYEQGLVFTQVVGGITSTRTVRVDAGINDGFSEHNIGGRRFLHYQRSQQSTKDAPLASAPIHSNIWLRLPAGGRLYNRDSGAFIDLPDNILLNPIMGTYLFDQDGISGLNTEDRTVRNLEVTYFAVARTKFALTIARPMLTIPAGSRLVIGEEGRAPQGELTNVKALAMFSLSPLEHIDCPTGNFNLLTGQGQNTPESISSAARRNSGTRSKINQFREGVDEKDYPGQNIGLGHPCMWVDEPENLDGDRLFLYRSRRRYKSDLQVNIISNDRTYVLGGKLRIEGAI